MKMILIWTSLKIISGLTVDDKPKCMSNWEIGIWGTRWCKKNLDRTQNFHARPNGTCTPPGDTSGAEQHPDSVSSWDLGGWARELCVYYWIICKGVTENTQLCN